MTESIFQSVVSLIINLAFIFDDLALAIATAKTTSKEQREKANQVEDADLPLYSGWITYCIIALPLLYITLWNNSSWLRTVCWIYLFVHWILFICKRYSDLQEIEAHSDPTEPFNGKVESAMLKDMFCLYLVWLFLELPVISHRFWNVIDSFDTESWVSQTLAVIYEVAIVSLLASVIIKIVYSFVGAISYHKSELYVSDKRIIELRKKLLFRKRKFVEIEGKINNRDSWGRSFFKILLFVPYVVFTILEVIVLIINFSFFDGIYNFSICFLTVLKKIAVHVSRILTENVFFKGRRVIWEIVLTAVLLVNDIYLMNTLGGDHMLTHFFELISTVLIIPIILDRLLSAREKT